MSGELSFSFGIWDFESETIQATSSSVSGLGIKVSGVTLKGSP